MVLISVEDIVLRFKIIGPFLAVYRVRTLVYSGPSIYGSPVFWRTAWIHDHGSLKALRASEWGPVFGSRF